MINTEYKEILICLDDEVLMNCIFELEPYLTTGWIVDGIETDYSTNASWITMKKPLFSVA